MPPQSDILELLLAPVSKTLQAARAFRFRRRLARESKRLAATPGFYFSRDPVGFKAEVWKDYLGAFAGNAKLKMLEIGSLEGKSGIWFLEHILTGEGSTLTCVDPWHPEIKLRFDHNIAVAGVADRIRVIRKPSAEALTEELAGERFDLIYIDGNHNAPYVLFDAVFSWPLLEPGGVMFFDDYGWRPDLPAGRRPKPAIDKLMEIYRAEMTVLHVDHQVVLRKMQISQAPGSMPRTSY